MQQQQGEAAGGAELQLQLQMRGGNEEEELVLATWDCGSPLYDSSPQGRRVFMAKIFITKAYFFTTN